MAKLAFTGCFTDELTYVYNAVSKQASCFSIEYFVVVPQQSVTVSGPGYNETIKEVVGTTFEIAVVAAMQLAPIQFELNDSTGLINKTFTLHAGTANYPCPEGKCTFVPTNKPQPISILYFNVPVYTATSSSNATVIIATKIISAIVHGCQEVEVTYNGTSTSVTCNTTLYFQAPTTDGNMTFKALAQTFVLDYTTTMFIKFETAFEVTIYTI